MSRDARETDTIRITTTADRAAALWRAAADQLAAGPEDVVLAEATAEVKEALGQPERARLYAKTLYDMGHPRPLEPVSGDAAGLVSDDYTERHPAFGMIGANRVSSTGATLAGSDFRHQHYITISIKRAHMARGLSHDRWSTAGDGPEVVEVALSEAQWATFISTLNVGDGIPATILWTETDGHMPSIVPTTNRRLQLHAEVDERLQHALELLRDVEGSIESSKQLGAGARKDLGDRARQARQELESNLDYVAGQFDKHAEETVERAKTEVEALVMRAIQRAGIKALAGDGPILELASGNEPEVIE